MTIPSESSFYVFSLHGLVTWNNILDGSSKQVTIVRSPSRKRRTVIKIEFRSSFSDFKRFLECVVRFPIRKRLEFESWERLSGIDLWEGHSDWNYKLIIYLRRKLFKPFIFYSFVFFCKYFHTDIILVFIFCPNILFIPSYLFKSTFFITFDTSDIISTNL